MTRTDKINYYIERFGLNSYLEIGVETFCNFYYIKAKNKESCDPVLGNINFHLTYQMTSDEMFELLDFDKKYDAIFIDGLHHYEQVLRDIDNSLKHLNKGGFIFIHDIIPINLDEAISRMPYDGGWNGDVYKIVDVLKDNFKYYTIDEDHGLLVIPYQEIDGIVPSISLDKMLYNEEYSNSLTYDKCFNAITDCWYNFIPCAILNSLSDDFLMCK